ncbi:MAG: N-acetyltransferase [Candidatus Deferrimicrobium sp.]
MVVIREEIASDVPAIRRLNEKAFGQSTEANIVDRLRSSCDRILFLVVVLDERIVGHILFSPVVLESKGREHSGMGLGPMAVSPSLQRQRIGSRLVEEGLARMRSAGCTFVVVLGHHEYYPHFGFERASKYGVRCQWEGVPDEAFMCRLNGLTGNLSRKAFLPIKPSESKT